MSRKFFTLNKIKPYFTTPRHHNSNSLIDKGQSKFFFNQNFKYNKNLRPTNKNNSYSIQQHSK